MAAIWAFLLVSTTAVASASKPSNFSVSTKIATTDENQKLLQIQFADAQKKSGVCPYTVQKFEFKDQAQNLSLSVKNQPCANDAFGSSSGSFYWLVPSNLLVAGKKLKVQINGQTVAVLLYETGSQSFRAEGTSVAK